MQQLIFLPNKRLPSATPSTADPRAHENCRELRFVLGVALFCVCLFGSAACAFTASPADNLAGSPAAVTRESAHGSCTLPNTYATDDEAIHAVIEAEANFVVGQEILALMQLWNNGSSIIDAKHTPLDPADDQRWLDKDAIRHRYVHTVFPGAPTTSSPKDLVITISGTQAIITATTNIGNEVSPAGDRWVLSKEEGCWGIESLTYNLESPQ